MPCDDLGRVGPKNNTLIKTNIPTVYVCVCVRAIGMCIFSVRAYVRSELSEQEPLGQTADCHLMRNHAQWRKGVGEAGRAVVCAEYDLILIKLELKMFIF